MTRVSPVWSAPCVRRRRAERGVERYARRARRCLGARGAAPLASTASASEIEPKETFPSRDLDLAPRVGWGALPSPPSSPWPCQRACARAARRRRRRAPAARAWSNRASQQWRFREKRASTGRFEGASGKGEMTMSVFAHRDFGARRASPRPPPTLSPLTARPGPRRRLDRWPTPSSRSRRLSARPPRPAPAASQAARAQARRSRQKRLGSSRRRVPERARTPPVLGVRAD